MQFEQIHFNDFIPNLMARQMSSSVGLNVPLVHVFKSMSLLAICRRRQPSLLTSCHLLHVLPAETRSRQRRPENIWSSISPGRLSAVTMLRTWTAAAVLVLADAAFLQQMLQQKMVEPVYLHATTCTIAKNKARSRSRSRSRNRSFVQFMMHLMHVIMHTTRRQQIEIYAVVAVVQCGTAFGILLSCKYKINGESTKSVDQSLCLQLENIILSSRLIFDRFG